MEPFTFILLELAFIIGLAAVGRGIALHLNQASVLGELTVGVLLGNILYWLGAPLATVIMHLEDTQKLVNEVWVSGAAIDEAASRVFTAQELAAGGIANELVTLLVGPHATEILLMTISLWIFSNLGVILLLFMVGLENSIAEMLKVGPRSLMVSIFGVVTPFFLGLLASFWLLPDASTPQHLFLGATLCATSVGITARVLGDLEQLKSQESRIILGAAVIDDILGLIILAIVIGIISSGSVQMLEVGRIVLLSGAFLVVVMLFGEKLVSWSVRLFYRIFNKLQVKLLFPLALAFLMAAFTNYIGLAAIVGAFAAGLIVLDEHFEGDSDTSPTTQDLINPIQTLFAPVFFVLMGMQVNLESFLHTDTLWLAAVFTIAAILGKLVAGYAAGKGINRLAVGLGMVPRGEVGLIFASIGKGLGVVDDSVFSAIVIMVVVTTLITPSLLKWSLERSTPYIK
ncbi:MAG: Na+/H+ antiporter [uncultured Thiotrichaceae bacterium]|uniref:Na+/H+ antiporter n=1 Tax=uncultured Thiotrichaceae bacterium TaxID=298394 RepID=A0A6S6T5X7_9GAMM|nr:MAG: Na+/H+ antiporter [uncultured Thiotrichaceae bacterium]